MPIREVGFQLRDQSPQLVLEWDVNQKATFLADAVGDLGIALTGNVFALQAVAPEFHFEPDINEDVLILASTSGTGVLFVRSEVNNIQFQVGLTTILALEPSKLTAFGTFDLTGSIEVSVGGIQVADGSFATPSYSFGGDVTQGMYLSAGGELGFGALRWSFGQDWVDLPDTTGDQFQIGDHSGSMALVLKGSTSATIIFTPDASLGYNTRIILDANGYSFNVRAVGFGSVENLLALQGTVGNGAATFTIPILAPAGSESAPAYSFSAGATTGFYDGAATLRLSLSGSQTMFWTATDVSPQIQFGLNLGRNGREWGTVFSLLVAAEDGTEGNPSHSFQDRPTSGMYMAGSLLAFSQNGTQRLRIGGSIDFNGDALPITTAAFDVGSGTFRWRSFLGGIINLERTAGGEMVKLTDSGGLGILANPHMAFYESASTRLGYVGFNSTSNSNLLLVTSISGASVQIGGSNGIQFTVADAANISSRSLNPAISSNVDLGGGSIIWRNTYSNTFRATGGNTPNAPAFTFNGDEDLGLYRHASDQLGFAMGGVSQYVMNTAEFRPVLDSAKDLGSNTLRFRTLYVDDLVITNGLPGIITQLSSVNFGQVNAGSSAIIALTVTGAQIGDAVLVSMGQAAALGGTTNLFMTGRVTTANTVTLTVHNYTAGNLDPATANIAIVVIAT